MTGFVDEDVVRPTLSVHVTLKNSGHALNLKLSWESAEALMVQYKLRFLKKTADIILNTGGKVIAVNLNEIASIQVNCTMAEEFLEEVNAAT